jgi:hypothetical protein
VTRTVRVPRAVRAVFGIVLCTVFSLSFQDKPRESVTVTAVEIPVRVFDKNGFVSGLNTEDFEIFENGVRQDITGFESVSRAIMPIPVALPESIPQAPRKRNFLLIFNVFDYNDQVGEAIDYFFKNVYREDDRLIIVVEDRVLSVGTADGVDSTVAGLKATLKAYKKISRIEIYRTYLKLDWMANAVAASLGGEETGESDPGGGGDVSGFFELYKHVWEDYRRRMLDVDMDLYRGIVARFNQMDGDKWAICFQQRDLFPRLKSQGRLDRALDRFFMSGSGISLVARNIEARKRDLDQSFDITKSFPADKLRTLFSEANITFHVLIMKSLQQGAMSRDFDLQDVRSDYEDVLRRISRATGGLTVFSNKVIDTLKEAAAKEDRYYLLVYQSKGKGSRKELEIDVKVKRQGANVVALKRFVGHKPPVISITGFEVKEKRVSFDIGNGSRLEQGGRNSGRAVVKITLFDGNSEKVFDEVKAFDIIADSIHLSLNFEKLPPGDHFIIIEAADLVSGEKDVFSRAIIL